MATMALGLLTAAPTIIQGVASMVHAIEHLFGKSNGTAKKAAVMSAFQGGIDAYSGLVSANTGLKLPNISKDAQKSFGNLIDAIVAFYHDTGIFTHAGE